MGPNNALLLKNILRGLQNEIYNVNLEGTLDIIEGNDTNSMTVS